MSEKLKDLEQNKARLEKELNDLKLDHENKPDEQKNQQAYEASSNELRNKLNEIAEQIKQLTKPKSKVTSDSKSLNNFSNIFRWKIFRHAS
jgi:septation ring formation regulator EzrA